MSSANFNWIELYSQSFLLTLLAALLLLALGALVWRQVRAEPGSPPPPALPFRLFVDESDTRTLDQSVAFDLTGYLARWNRLTNRERQIAQLIAAGQSDREIATELSITLRTAQNHAYNIFQKMEIKQRSALKFIVPQLLD
jgi:DNA-binding CsgD family transcriptional regulator